MKHEKKIIKKLINGRCYTWTIFEKEKRVSCRITCTGRRLANDIYKVIETKIPANYPGLKLKYAVISDDFIFNVNAVTECCDEDVFDENVGMKISRLKAERDLHNIMMQELDNFIRAWENHGKELRRLRENYKKKYKKASEKNAQ